MQGILHASHEHLGFTEYLEGQAHDRRDQFPLDATMAEHYYAASFAQDGAAEGRGHRVATLMIFHEVDDVDRWLASPRRNELAGPLGATMRTFVDPQKSNRVGILAEIPDMAGFQQFMASDAAAEAMKSDGVRPETIVMLVES
jgi:hypothetical protein